MRLIQLMAGNDPKQAQFPIATVAEMGDGSVIVKFLVPPYVMEAYPNFTVFENAYRGRQISAVQMFPSPQRPTVHPAAASLAKGVLDLDLTDSAAPDTLAALQIIARQLTAPAPAAEPPAEGTYGPEKPQESEAPKPN